MTPMSYLIPAPYTGMSTRSAHLRRQPPSTEPGTDYYMPIGTPLRAPVSGRVVAVGGGINPATGRFVTIDDGIRWLRFLHLSAWRCEVGDDLDEGDIFGLSGSSGYGSEFFGAAHPFDVAMLLRTGGPHVHVTAFRGRAYTFGSTGTVDFHALTGGEVAGGSTPGAEPPLNTPISEESMIIHLVGKTNVRSAGLWLFTTDSTGKKVARRLGSGDDATGFPHIGSEAEVVSLAASFHGLPV